MQFLVDAPNTGGGSSLIFLIFRENKFFLLYFTIWYAVLLDKFHLIIITPVQRRTAV